MEKYLFPQDQLALMEGMQVPFAIYQFIDRRVYPLVLSEGLLRLFGYEDREKAYYDMEHDMYVDTHPEDAARIADAAFRFASQGGTYEAVYRSRKRDDGGYRVIHAKGEHFYTDTGVRLAQVWYTDEGAYEEGMSLAEEGLPQRMSSVVRRENLITEGYYDSLTGLPNMTYFFELADAGRQSMIEKGANPALVYFDLNGMKFYNREHGFSEGNRLLCAFADILSRHFSNENCSRFSQDHFAVFTEEKGLEDRLGRVFSEVEKMNGGKTLPVRAGIYLDRMESVETSAACDRAKFACDSTKGAYRSGFSYYDGEMQLKEDLRRYITANIDRAIENRWIEVYYQGIVRAVNGRVCEEEALARWIDPELGFLSPGDFIPTLEESQLIYKLDLYVVDRIIEKINKMKAEGYYIVPQSVNLSRSDFDSCDIVEEIRRKVDEGGIGRDKLTIEITESIIGRDFDFMNEQVERFRALGFKVWMDDFGSGYSSLDVLQSIKFHLIKFDMRFMQQLREEDSSGKIILTELIKMATSLGIDTVCEGVETIEQVQFLREIGCSKLQGFYFAKPCSLEDIFRRYAEGRQIGFENPEESDYYEAMGKANLYDLDMVERGEEKELGNFFDTLPMSVLEVCGDRLRLVRTNPAWRDFMGRKFGLSMDDRAGAYAPVQGQPDFSLMERIRLFSGNGKRAFVDEKLPDGSVMHLFLRRIASNPVKGTVAVAAAVLSIMDVSEGLDYAAIARALAADYFNIFYVDLETEEFIEYSSNPGREMLAVERRGKDFFSASRRDARKVLLEEDQESFIAAFTRENVVRVIKEEGAFTTTYRMVQPDGPVCVNMKAVRVDEEGRHIIIGVGK